LMSMEDRRQDNLLIVHWHDTGRWLGAYGHRGVSSPCLDRLAAESILFTRAHAAAPQCSPSRGALFTGRYPHSNGLIGLAHHGFEYRDGVSTLPQILADAGWYSALFGMQHETSFPARLGFDEFDVSDSGVLNQSLHAWESGSFALELEGSSSRRWHPGSATAAMRREPPAAASPTSWGCSSPGTMPSRTQTKRVPAPERCLGPASQDDGSAPASCAPRPRTSPSHALPHSSASAGTPC
jgi:arylsulfatase A-like enzyme